jgi:hypothetical protein
MMVRRPDLDRGQTGIAPVQRLPNAKAEKKIWAGGFLRN